MFPINKLFFFGTEDCFLRRRGSISQNAFIWIETWCPLSWSRPGQNLNLGFWHGKRAAYPWARSDHWSQTLIFAGPYALLSKKVFFILSKNEHFICIGEFSLKETGWHFSGTFCRKKLLWHPGKVWTQVICIASERFIFELLMTLFRLWFICKQVTMFYQLCWFFFILNAQEKRSFFHFAAHKENFLRSTQPHL